MEDIITEQDSQSSTPGSEDSTNFMDLPASQSETKEAQKLLPEELKMREVRRPFTFMSRQEPQPLAMAADNSLGGPKSDSFTAPPKKMRKDEAQKQTESDFPEASTQGATSTDSLSVTVLQSMQKGF